MPQTQPEPLEIVVAYDVSLEGQARWRAGLDIIIALINARDAASQHRDQDATAGPVAEPATGL
jgi:hypothetical protein